MSQKILVVGSFVQDLTFTTEKLPVPGQTVVGRFSTGPGGKGSNQAVAARRAGGDVEFISAVGEDAFAQEVRAFYAAEDLDARLHVIAGEATGTAGILVDAGAQNAIVVALGANAGIEREHIPDDVLQAADLLVCQCEINLQTNFELLQRARAAGIKTILNPAPMPASLPADALAAVDILIPNETEFAALLQQQAGKTVDPDSLAAQEDATLHRWCRALEVPAVVVTLGKAGVFISTPEKYQRIAAISGIKAIDTTGAGDAFVGAFATAYLQFGTDLFQAAKFANAAAAISVTRHGTAPATARRAEIDALLAKQPGA